MNDKDVNIFSLYFRVYKRVFDYRGVSSRAEFFTFYIITASLIILFSYSLAYGKYLVDFRNVTIDKIASIYDGTSFVFGFLSFPFLLPLTIRRIRDTGLSAYWFIAYALYGFVAKVFGGAFITEIIASYINMDSIGKFFAVVITATILTLALCVIPLVIGTNEFRRSITPAEKKLTISRRAGVKTRAELNSEIDDLRSSVKFLSKAVESLQAENKQLRARIQENRIFDNKLDDNLPKRATPSIKPYNPDNGRYQAATPIINTFKKLQTDKKPASPCINDNTHEKDVTKIHKEEFARTSEYINSIEAYRDRNSKNKQERDEMLDCMDRIDDYHDKKNKVLEESYDPAQFKHLSNAERDEVAKRIARKLAEQAKQKTHQNGYIKDGEYYIATPAFIEVEDSDLADREDNRHW